MTQCHIKPQDPVKAIPVARSDRQSFSTAAGQLQQHRSPESPKLVAFSRLHICMRARARTPLQVCKCTRVAVHLTCLGASPWPSMVDSSVYSAVRALHVKGSAIRLLASSLPHCPPRVCCHPRQVAQAHQKKKRLGRRSAALTRRILCFGGADLLLCRRKHLHLHYL